MNCGYTYVELSKLLWADFRLFFGRYTNKLVAYSDLGWLISKANDIIGR
jgi:hypothetical protein